MASSDPDIAGLNQRALTPSDLGGAAALSAEAGWNQTEDDWRLMLSFGRGFALDAPARPVIATALTLPYPGGFGWISMVLVTAGFRRRGLATHLMRCCVDSLRSDGLVPILDATPAGREVYRQIGFRDAWTFQRLRLTHRPAESDPMPAGIDLRPLAATDWPAVLELDAEAFGGDRSVVLRHLAARIPAAAWVAERSGRIGGFVLARDGRRAMQIGPLIATDPAIARALAAEAMAATAGPWYVDLADHQPAMDAWLAQSGAEAERPFTRMLHERSAAFGKAALVYAVTGPELG